MNCRSRPKTSNSTFTLRISASSGLTPLTPTPKSSANSSPNLSTIPAVCSEPASALRRTTLLYALTIFASAFLLFQVQPLITKMILPWFGGVAAVWTVCLLFFQVVLLAGYFYAHALTTRFSSRMQARIHAAIAAASLLALPILPKNSLKPSGSAAPAWHVLAILALTVGLPYFVLSATSPLLQAWY